MVKANISLNHPYELIYIYFFVYKKSNLIIYLAVKALCRQYRLISVEEKRERN